MRDFGKILRDAACHVLHVVVLVLAQRRSLQIGSAWPLLLAHSNHVHQICEVELLLRLEFLERHEAMDYRPEPLDRRHARALEARVVALRDAVVRDVVLDEVQLLVEGLVLAQVEDGLLRDHDHIGLSPRVPIQHHLELYAHSLLARW